MPIQNSYRKNKKTGEIEKRPIKIEGKHGNELLVTDEQRQVVLNAASVGLPNRIICKLVGNGISEPTLMKHFREELDKGKASGLNLAANALMTLIHKGDFQAIKFYLATQGQGAFNEKQQLDINANVSRVDLSPDNLQLIAQATKKLDSEY